MPEEPAETTWQTPENLLPKCVKTKLCDLGPEKCPDCMLCAFGKFIVKYGVNGETAPKRKGRKRGKCVG